MYRRRDEGWVAWRVGGTSAFRGKDGIDVCDVVAMRGVTTVSLGGMAEACLAEVLMIEVKTTAQGPFERFGPTQREALILAAKLAGATPLLVWWPANGERRELTVAEWPLTRND